MPPSRSRNEKKKWKQIFDCYEYINNLSDIILEDNIFSNDGEIDDVELEINFDDNDNSTF